MTWLRHPIAYGFAALLLAIVAASTFAIVPETEQAVILRFEQPVGQPINQYRRGEMFGRTGAGLIARIPTGSAPGAVAATGEMLIATDGEGKLVRRWSDSPERPEPLDLP